MITLQITMEDDIDHLFQASLDSPPYLLADYTYLFIIGLELSSLCNQNLAFFLKHSYIQVLSSLAMEFH
jgi:hypothetical protein